MLLLTLIFTSFLGIALATFKNPHYVGNRTTMVQLHEWKFCDIAKECEEFLGPYGFAGVQISPITENLIIEGCPWYDRYQPISYKIISRSGNESEFKDMVYRCNKVGVRIYVDVVLNHMCGDANPANGTGGSSANPGKRCYPKVPYTSDDFHCPCQIRNYTNATEVRNCELSGLHDLDHGKLNVILKILDFLNLCIKIGVAGFRIDAAKYMWPKDLLTIFLKLNLLSTKYGFPPNSRPFIYQDVDLINVDLGVGLGVDLGLNLGLNLGVDLGVHLGVGSISKFEYNPLACVTGHQYGYNMSNMCQGKGKLVDLNLLINPTIHGLLPSLDALVMIDNHYTQRGQGASGSTILTHKNGTLYKIAVILMLAHPYGYPRIMSSYNFSNPNQGPPNLNCSIISPIFNTSNGQCINGWVCEHRWPEFYRMVKFRNLVHGLCLENWWSNGTNQIAFSRGNKGFIVVNLDVEIGDILSAKLQTGLPPGIYCDIITGDLINGNCTGKSVVVDAQGFISINLLPGSCLVIYIGAKLNVGLGALLGLGLNLDLEVLLKSLLGLGLDLDLGSLLGSLLNSGSGSGLGSILGLGADLGLGSDQILGLAAGLGLAPDQILRLGANLGLGSDQILKLKAALGL